MQRQDGEEEVRGLEAINSVCFGLDYFKNTVSSKANMPCGERRNRDVKKKVGWMKSKQAYRKNNLKQERKTARVNIMIPRDRDIVTENNTDMSINVEDKG